jgi:arylsulfatase A-like enzyme
VIWYGSPHAPFGATDADRAPFASLPALSQHHHGELVAMDRSIGALRRGLRELGLADNTLLWFCSDNGGLPEVTPSSVGPLRGFKNTLYEGGLRVPGLVEWPAVIKSPRATSFAAGVVDIFPTIADFVGLPESALLKPVDGISLRRVFTAAAEVGPRPQALPFRHSRRAAWIEQRYKLVTPDVFAAQTFELYDLETDPAEKNDLAAAQPEVFARLRTALLAWQGSVEKSVAGQDYPEGAVSPKEPASRDWATAPEYAPYLAQWATRPEFQSALNPKAKKAKKN